MRTAYWYAQQELGLNRPGQSTTALPALFRFGDCSATALPRHCHWTAYSVADRPGQSATALLTLLTSIVIYIGRNRESLRPAGSREYFFFLLSNHDIRILDFIPRNVFNTLKPNTAFVRAVTSPTYTTGSLQYPCNVGAFRDSLQTRTCDERVPWKPPAKCDTPGMVTVRYGWRPLQDVLLHCLHIPRFHLGKGIC